MLQALQTASIKERAEAMRIDEGNGVTNNYNL